MRERERGVLEGPGKKEGEGWGPIHRPYTRSLTKTKPICDLFSESNLNPHPKTNPYKEREKSSPKPISSSRLFSSLLFISPKLSPTPSYLHTPCLLRLKMVINNSAENLVGNTKNPLIFSTFLVSDSY